MTTGQSTVSRCGFGLGGSGAALGTGDAMAGGRGRGSFLSAIPASGRRCEMASLPIRSYCRPAGAWT